MIDRPELPVNNNVIRIKVSNRILNDFEVNDIISNPLKPVYIFFEGDIKFLDILLQQLSSFRTNNIELNIGRCIIDYNVCLPFHFLGDNIKISFFDNVSYGSGFNDYLMNCNDVIFNEAMLKLSDFSTKTRIIQEKSIREEFLSDILTELDRRNVDITKWNNKQKMDFFFHIIKSNYPYDWSITNNGHYIPDSTLKGGTALVVYQRGKGICEGRSKLLKVVTNNNIINLPCFLVEGDYGVDKHIWNEIITEDGSVIEYDLSFGRICSLDKLENGYGRYRNINHEYGVDKVLKRNK